MNPQQFFAGDEREAVVVSPRGIVLLFRSGLHWLSFTSPAAAIVNGRGGGERVGGDTEQNALCPVSGQCKV
jgi:hypothetical protein